MTSRPHALLAYQSSGETRAPRPKAQTVESASAERSPEDARIDRVTAEVRALLLAGMAWGERSRRQAEVDAYLDAFVARARARFDEWGIPFTAEWYAAHPHIRALLGDRVAGDKLRAPDVHNPHAQPVLELITSPSAGDVVGIVARARVDLTQSEVTEVEAHRDEVLDDLPLRPQAIRPALAPHAPPTPRHLDVTTHEVALSVAVAA